HQPHQAADEPRRLDPPDRFDRLPGGLPHRRITSGFALPLDLRAQSLFVLAKLGRELGAEVLGLEHRPNLHLPLPPSPPHPAPPRTPPHSHPPTLSRIP